MLDLTSYTPGWGQPYMPHGHCYLWQPGLVGLHIASDLSIAIAYFSIPSYLVYLSLKRSDMPFRGTFGLFAAFIVSCGIVHLGEVWTLWHPDYWILGVLKAFTAVISLFTSLKLAGLIPLALALPNTALLETINQALTQEIFDGQQVQQTLKQINETLERELRVSESIFRNIFVNAPLGIVLGNLQGNILKVNPALSEILGYTSEDLLTYATPEHYLSRSGQINCTKNG